MSVTLKLFWVKINFGEKYIAQRISFTVIFHAFSNSFWQINQAIIDYYIPVYLSVLVTINKKKINTEGQI